MDALDLLHRDHERIQELAAELEETTERAERTRESLFAEIRRNLEAHETIEEEIFYPALQEHPRARDLVLEGYVEHDVVDGLTWDLAEMAVDDESWGPTAKVMIENLRHHIGEEEDELFPKARQVFDEGELDELGERLSRRRSELLDGVDATARREG